MEDNPYSTAQFFLFSTFFFFISIQEHIYDFLHFFKFCNQLYFEIKALFQGPNVRFLSPSAKVLDNTISFK